ncbi:hypothetical protein C5167_047998, partial [Papaver somniferum]
MFKGARTFISWSRASLKYIILALSGNMDDVLAAYKADIWDESAYGEYFLAVSPVRKMGMRRCLKAMFHPPSLSNMMRYITSSSHKFSYVHMMSYTIGPSSSSSRSLSSTHFVIISVLFLLTRCLLFLMNQEVDFPSISLQRIALSFSPLTNCRREKEDQIEMQLLAAEIQAAMQLAKRREDEIKNLKNAALISRGQNQKCFIFGLKGAGRSSLLNYFLGRYMLSRAVVPRHAIIKKFIGKEIAQMDDLILVLFELSRGARVPLEYISYVDRHRNKKKKDNVDDLLSYALENIQYRDGTVNELNEDLQSEIRQQKKTKGEFLEMIHHEENEFQAGNFVIGSSGPIEIRKQAIEI